MSLEYHHTLNIEVPCYHYTLNIEVSCYHHTLNIEVPCYHHTLNIEVPCYHHTLNIEVPCYHHTLNIEVPCYHHTLNIEVPCCQYTLNETCMYPPELQGTETPLPMALHTYCTYVGHHVIHCKHLPLMKNAGCIKTCISCMYYVCIYPKFSVTHFSVSTVVQFPYCTTS